MPDADAEQGGDDRQAHRQHRAEGDQQDDRRRRGCRPCLQLAGFETYAPRIRQQRVSRGRKIERRPLLFVNYCFVRVVQQWWAAHRTPGVLRLICAGDVPARVPDAIIAELRRRERGGLIELDPAAPRFRPGDRVRVTKGAFSGHLARLVSIEPHERVAVLLALLGGRVRVELPEAGIEPARTDIEPAGP